MKLAVVREVGEGETRVALVPESVKKLTAAGLRVTIERGAGERAHFADAGYISAGATIVSSSAEALADAEMMLGVGAPSAAHVAHLMPNSMVLCSLMPTRNLAIVRALADRNITAFSTDAIPRTTRAQGMDTLSSMANIAGYKGALLGALELNKYVPMLMTAAGTIMSAKFFVIGAGVAGLQAIATARRLGAQVSATDVRPEVKEQIESVGAKYVGIELAHSALAGGGYAKELSSEDKARQAQLLAEQCAVSDVVVTTALIGGVFAPKLISADVVRRMRPGAVIVDLAADGGGNCELSRPGTTVIERGVKILRAVESRRDHGDRRQCVVVAQPHHFLVAFWKDKAFALNLDDEIMRGAVITHRGEIMHGATRNALLSAVDG